jgi:hypothetical protein
MKECFVQELEKRRATKKTENTIPPLDQHVASCASLGSALAARNVEHGHIPLS